MNDLIKEWAQAGDPNAQIRLAEFYLTEGNLDEAKKFFEAAAEKNYRPAAKRLAEIFHEDKYYKQAVEQGDEEAIDALIELYPTDKEILDFVLKNIDKHYNDIYDTRDILRRMMSLGSRRNEEYTPQYGRAIERRRIRNKILKLKEALA